MSNRGISITDSLCYAGSIRFVLDHTAGVSARSAGWIFLPMSSPGIRATPYPAVGPVLGSIHSTGLKDFFHRYRAHQQTGDTVRHLNARENRLSFNTRFIGSGVEGHLALFSTPLSAI